MQNKTQPVGFNCPKCNSFVEVSFKSLLSQASINCPFCLISFTMDRNESKHALELMQKLNTALDNLEATKNFKPQ